MMKPPIASASKTIHTARALVCLLGALTLACDHHRVEETATQELRFNTGARTVVEIRVDDGAIEVTGGADGYVEVVFTTRARSTDSTRARSLLQNARAEATQEDDVVRIRAHSASNARRLGGSVSTDVTVRVPSAGTDLELDIRTEDGSIEIAGVTGSTVAETGDGRIRLSQVDGTTRLRTADGPITGKELTGELDALSGNGRIRLDGSFTQLRAVTADGSIRVVCQNRTRISSDWSLRSSDGSIELSLPPDTNARVEATSGDGQVVNHLSRFNGSERSSRIKGEIGTGGPFILITTLDGRIVLRDS